MSPFASGRPPRGSFVVLLSAAAASACGLFGADDDGAMEGPETDFFSNACIGTLIEEVALQERTGPEQWTEITATGQPGQQVVLGIFSRTFFGYLLVDGDVTARVGTDPFERDVHFTVDCIDDPIHATTRKVTLMDTNLYETQELSGEPCLIEAGTVLEGAYIAGNVSPGVREVSSQGVEDICGLVIAYTPDIVTDDLARLPYPGPQ